ncbi:MAG: hypothetical protein AAGH42_01970 [Pseudomonadota bacterium]
MSDPITRPNDLTTLLDLGLGGGHAVWGFRAAIVNHTDCATLIHGFENIMSAYGRPALHSLSLLAQVLGAKGNRQLSLACPGCGVVTADEMSIVAVLAAEQVGDDAESDAYLAWLMAGRGEREAKEAAHRVASIFSAAHVPIDTPPIEITMPTKHLSNISFHAVGNA